MSSLILRWSLDNSSPSQPPPPPKPLPPSPSTVSQGGGVGGGGGEDDGRLRQRELRSSLQAFLEIRQVWRLLSGKGETDRAVLSIAGGFAVGAHGRWGVGVGAIMMTHAIVADQ